MTLKNISTPKSDKNKLTSVMIILALIIVTISMISGHAQRSYDMTSKLHIFRDGVDYKNALARETLAPDLIIFHDGQIKTGMSERQIIETLGSDFKIIEKYNYPTRKQQRVYLNFLLSSNDNSMHYYILADVFYDQKLEGWFRIYEWEISDVKIWAFVVLQVKWFKISPPAVWLLHAAMTPVEDSNVKYIKSDSLILIRHGLCDIRWNASSNTLQIIDSIKAQ